MASRDSYEISAIVLAAGLARRFGSAKPLALCDEKPLVRHVVEALSVPAVRDVIVVAPRDSEPYATALADTRARCVVNERSEEGMSSSLRVGLAALHEGTQAVLVALADQPTIERDVVASLIEAWRERRAPVVAPSYRGERGHPVLFDATMLSELRAISGDRGARNVIDRDPRRVHLVLIDRELPRDVDTPADLAALRRIGPDSSESANTQH